MYPVPIMYMSTVNLNLLINDTPDSFLPGQTIKGTLTITLPPGLFLEICGIYLQFRGVERIRFRQRAGVHRDDNFIRAVSDADMTVSTGIPTILPINQPHFLQQVLTSLTIPISRFRGKLSAGSSHSFQFNFKLDGKLPPSTNFSASGSKYSASIEYEIFIQIFCKNYDNNLTLNKTIKLNNLMRESPLPSFQEEKLEFKQSFLQSCLKSCLFGIYHHNTNHKVLHFHADWKRNNFTSGDTVDFNFTLKSVDGLLSVKLVRELFLIIDERNTFRTINPVAKSKLNLNKEADYLINGSAQLVIPRNLEPSVGTKAIDCRYFFVFEIKLKGLESSLMTSEVHIY